MTTTEKAPSIRQTRGAGPLIVWFVGLFVVTVVTLLAGVGVAALLARRGDAANWSKWSDVGQTFGALSSIISGLALVAVVVTARAQFRELANNHSELRRTAQANHGMLHLEILKMSIENPDLARVWPPFLPNLSADLNRQYLYANVIYQFHWTSMRIGDYTDEEVLASLRYLFTSPLMRDYWRAAEYARTSLPPGSDEYIFAQKVDQVCREYEAVVASATGPAAERAPTPLRDNQKPAQAV
jgi:uncharacterized protein DUF6082